VSTEQKPSPRAGATALTLLSAPLNIAILRTLEEGPESVIDLRKKVCSPPQSTMRIYLRTLNGLGAVERSQEARFQGSVRYAITPAGQALLGVAETVRVWLQASPEGPIELGTPAAKSAIKALVEGWSSNIVRVLAARPASLTELNRMIPKLSYPSLERRLTAMRLVGLVEGRRGARVTPYAATEWLRHGVAPLIAASEWEREYAPELTPPLGRLDIEATFLLAIPLMALSADVNGKVRLAVEVRRGASPVFAGVLVGVEDGEVTSCVPGLDGEAQSWVSGAPRSWLRRISKGEKDHLEVGGDSPAARAVLEGLHRTVAGIAGYSSGN
jgi:DNA-binding HxlR family transcriptional regulator